MSVAFLLSTLSNLTLVLIHFSTVANFIFCLPVHCHFVLPYMSMWPFSDVSHPDYMHVSLAMLYIQLLSCSMTAVLLTKLYHKHNQSNLFLSSLIPHHQSLKSKHFLTTIFKHLILKHTHFLSSKFDKVVNTCDLYLTDVRFEYWQFFIFLIISRKIAVELLQLGHYHFHILSNA